MKRPSEQGFTLIEIVVVMAIVAVLAVLIVGAINIAKRQTKTTQAQTTLREITAAFQAYSIKTKQQPPMGDAYSAWAGVYDGSQTSAYDSWKATVDAMVSQGVINQSVADKYYTDPWGSPYVYDDNYGQCWLGVPSTQSLFGSAGQDQKWDSGDGNICTGDDICSDINHGDQGCIWSY